MSGAQAIWKFLAPISPDATAVFEIPAPATIVSARLGMAISGHADSLIVWAIVNPDAPKVRRFMHVVGTGWAVPADVRHVATHHQGAYVWHIFEEAQA